MPIVQIIYNNEIHIHLLSRTLERGHTIEQYAQITIFIKDFIS